MNEYIKSILLTREQIAERVLELAREIDRDYEGKNPLFVCVLRGAFIFLGDLVRAVETDCTVDFMAVTSYGSGTENSGVVRIVKDLEDDIAGRHVIIVEDILDSGLTLSYIMGLIGAKNPASIAVCALLNKEARRKVPVKADYKGFDIPDEFVVGYGLDCNGKYRNLPYIGQIAFK